MKQVPHLVHDAVLVGPDQLHGAGQDGLGTLGGVPHDQYGLAQTRGLLLHATTVGQHQVGAVHQVAEVPVAKGLDQTNIRQPGDRRLNGLAHHRIEVDGKDDLQLRLGPGDAGQGPPDGLHRRPPGFAAVGGHQ